jgi:hypothetical protein
MSEKVKSIFLDNTTVLSGQIVDHDLTKPWKTISGEDNPNINNDSIVAYWRFNDTSGYDSSGNSHDIVWTSQPSLSDDTPFKNNNKTVKFNGIDNDGAVTDNDDLTFVNGTSDTPFSISCWIKPETTGVVGHKYIIKKYDSYTENLETTYDREYSLYLYETSDEKLILVFLVYDEDNNKFRRDSLIYEPTSIQ